MNESEGWSFSWLLAPASAHELVTVKKKKKERKKSVRLNKNTMAKCAPSGGREGGVLPMTAYTARLRPREVPCSGQGYERVGISLVQLYERVGKYVLWVCERAQKS